MIVRLFNEATDLGTFPQGEAARTRFKASTIVPDYVFMLVKPDRGACAGAGEQGERAGALDGGPGTRPGALL